MDVLEDLLRITAHFLANYEIFQSSAHYGATLSKLLMYFSVESISIPNDMIFPDATEE